MPTKLHRYYGAGYLHLIPTSCDQRTALLGTPQNRDLFLEVMEQVRRRYRFVVVGYVVMPEHVHLLFREAERGDWSAVPVANLTNPQTLNLYSMVADDPESFADLDGHLFDAGAMLQNGTVEVAGHKENPTVAKQTTTQQQAQKPLPPPDANHNHTLTIRYVSGQEGNPAGHITVQIDNGKQVGFAPVQDLTKKQILENTSVPGQVEPRAAGVTTLDAVTIHLTKDEASHAQGTIDDRTNNPGNYELRGRSCVDFGEDVVRSTGSRAPSDTLPSHLILDIRGQQIQDNTTQAP